MDRRVGRSFSKYRDNLVLRYEKPEHAFLDDSNACGASRSADLSAGRIRQSVPGRDQCQSRTVRNYVREADADRESIALRRPKGHEHINTSFSSHKIKRTSPGW